MLGCTVDTVDTVDTGYLGSEGQSDGNTSMEGIMMSKDMTVCCETIVVLYTYKYKKNICMNPTKTCIMYTCGVYRLYT